MALDNNPKTAQAYELAGSMKALSIMRKAAAGERVLVMGFVDWKIFLGLAETGPICFT